MNNFPKQDLLFFIEESVSKEIKASFRIMINELAANREWLVAPPTFFENIEDFGTRPEDVPVETIGGIITILAAIESNLPRDLDIKTLEDVEFAMDRIKSFSLENNLSIIFELDGQSIGAIESGELDKSLNKGLIGEWRRNLGVESVSK